MRDGTFFKAQVSHFLQYRRRPSLMRDLRDTIIFLSQVNQSLRLMKRHTHRFFNEEIEFIFKTPYPNVQHHARWTNHINAVRP